jgi:hypothetical protein
MFIRCTKCYIKLRAREILFCGGLNKERNTNIQLCTDCMADYLEGAK